MSNLAELYDAKGDYQRAELLLQRVLTIYEKTDGPQQLNVARILGNLAAMYYQQGDYERAEPLYVRAVNIEVKARGEEHPSVASVLSNLAALYRRKGDYSRAEVLLQRALSSYLKAFGPDHNLVASLLSGFADLYRDRGDQARAVQVMQRALEIREQNLKLILTSGSEQQKQIYLDYLSTETSYALSLHLQSAPTNQQAANLAFATILRRKGRALDAMTDQIAALRRRASPEDNLLLDQLSGARSQLATLRLSGAGAFTPETRKAETTRLTSAIEQLEDQVSRRSSEFRALSKSVTLDAVRRALPSGSALVEIAAYRPFDPKFKNYSQRFGPARYVAYVLRADSDISTWVELGAADSIDADITRLRAALHDPKRADVKELARALDERVMRPVRRLLGDARQILISPDGALNLIPFAALVDERGHYLIEAYTISYLTSGRDLLRLQVNVESRSGPVVMGDPLYDAPPLQARPSPINAKPNPVPQGSANRRSVDFAALTYQPLPGTAQEAKGVESLMPGARLFLQREATEGALKQVKAPRVLHIATHGFFLNDQSSDGGPENRALSHVTERDAPMPQRENPLLRSGLVLAGVKQQQSGEGEDGVLTALEAVGLDLWGTQLVVLSACETGLGEVHNGAGVYGLRRALVLAGSETQVMSLWSVDDVATRDLMMGFYKRLQSGEERAEALRRVQLDMLTGASLEHSGEDRGLKFGKRTAPGSGFSHPYYWAPFVESGAWTKMAPAR